MSTIQNSEGEFQKQMPVSEEEQENIETSNASETHVPTNFINLEKAGLRRS